MRLQRVNCGAEGAACVKAHLDDNKDVFFKANRKTTASSATDNNVNNIQIKLCSAATYIFKKRKEKKREGNAAVFAWSACRLLQTLQERSEKRFLAPETVFSVFGGNKYGSRS